jgi:uncharacterized protein YbjT (DUF2867 family)
MLITAKNPCFSVDDTGAWVVAAFLDPETWIGKDLRVVTEWLSTRDMASIASRVVGKKVVPMELDEASFDATKDADYPGAEELYKNLKYFATVISFIRFVLMHSTNRKVESGIRKSL